MVKERQNWIKRKEKEKQNLLLYLQSKTDDNGRIRLPKDTLLYRCYKEGGSDGI